jgi:starvation-inducible DNA-binding protein
MLDEFATHALDSIDEMAERIRMIGPDVQAVQLKQFQQAASIQSARADQTMREMMEETHAHLLVVIQDMREAARVANENDDPSTVDLFSKIVQLHERDEWFLRKVLKKRTAWLCEVKYVRSGPHGILLAPYKFGMQDFPTIYKEG